MMLLLHLSIFILGILALIYLQKIGVSRNKRTLIAILIGGIIGTLLQIFGKEVSNTVLQGYNILAIGYIRFLQMLVYPVVSLAILLAFIKIGENSNSIKSSAYIILLLLATTGVSVLVAIIVTVAFNLDISLISGALSYENLGQELEAKKSALQKPFYQFITDFISINPFQDLTGARAPSLASIIIFLSFIGFAYINLKKTEEVYAQKFQFTVELMYKLLMYVVAIALKLTPYGILGLFAKLTATSNISDILKLLNFVLISYIAIAIMFLIHGLILLSTKLNPITYYKKVMPVLIFSFFSRSSSASIPMNIEIQTQNLKISQNNAVVSAAFGSSIGQNGCAGIYPAMLVSALAPSFGINPLDPFFVLTMMLIIVVNSFGIAGVGGGALFAGIAALTAFNMPIAIIPLLAGVEPIIDMARTALNVNGTIVSSVITSKLSKEITAKDWQD